jgi:hypothetical protein
VPGRTLAARRLAVFGLPERPPADGGLQTGVLVLYCQVLEGSMNVHRLFRRGVVIPGVVVLLSGLLTAGVAWANGEEFFGTKDTKLDMYYFGHIKDTDGKVLDNAVVTVVAKNLNMKFPFRNDAPGHFRSPDIGKAIKGLGKAIDPAQMEITIVKKGYVMASPVKLPIQAEGGIGPIDFILKPAPTAAPSTN